MKILLFGKNGQVGWELQRALSPLGELVALDRHGEGSLCGDLSNLEALSQTIQTIAPQIIVNAAAYTAVDRAEDNLDLASLINAKAPAIMAREAAALGSLLVHYSSDYVFDGQGNSPRKESDFPAPVNYYGRSKWEGEQAIQASGCNHLIFRTSWVYATIGPNFAKTMLIYAKKRNELTVINDQIGVPTGADLLADVTAHSIRKTLNNPEISGLYHVAPHGETSWYDYANFVLDNAKNLGEVLQIKQITPIPSNEYPTRAKRPLNSRLDTTKFSDTFLLSLPHWTTGVLRMLKETVGSPR